ncbi:tail protein X [Vibrio parahaemolyticus]|uniref:tail protein X n=1 Tax=Vibrio parahaemolyticus TaxID=670 RepID=UPI002B20FB3A|nr:tail protein X [Vibrio parahaemolyticus]MEA5281423.1 tail protein X [Vibrio parahaemolyticus]
MSTTTLYAQRGERWDQFCYRAYSSASETLVMTLREANRTLASDMDNFEFDGGEVVTIPALEVSTVIEDTTEKPPWAE